MKTVLLAILATTAIAVEVQPAPGTDLDPTGFSDLRLVLGVSAPVSEAEAAGVAYECDPDLGAHAALQWVGGTAGRWVGAALGVEVAYDDAVGNVSRATGVQTVYGVGDTRLRSVGVAVVPKLVLRPDYGDPFDWAPGRVHVELGPVLGAGVGWARIGGSPMSDPTMVVRWGARLDVVWTDPDHLWQVGASLAWEGMSADPDLSGEASISGDGICGGLILGRRL